MNLIELNRALQRLCIGGIARQQAQFRDPRKTVDNFDFNFNKKMNRSLVFDLATAAFIALGATCLRPSDNR